MSAGPQWYSRVVRPCETCAGTGWTMARNEFGDMEQHLPRCPDCSGGYVDVDATEECGECRGSGRECDCPGCVEILPDDPCHTCHGSGRAPSLAALALHSDTVLIQSYGVVGVVDSVGTEWVLVTYEGLHKAFRSNELARVVTVDDVERRGRFAWRGEK